jgi:hypothetical protein
MPEAPQNRAYTLAEVCHATQMKPGAFKQLVHRGILAPADKPPQGVHRGYRLAEIWSAALILELAKRGLLQMQAANVVAGIKAKGRWWTHRDRSKPSNLFVWVDAEGRAHAAKLGGSEPAWDTINRWSSRDDTSASAVILNVTEVLDGVDQRLSELIAASDQPDDDIDDDQ